MINLTTLAHVRRLLGKDIDASFDDDLENRITDISYRIQALYSVDLEQQTYVEIKDGGGRRIYVNNPPIVSVTSVIASNDLDFVGGEVIPATDYAIVNKNWDIAHVNCWPAGPNGLQVTYIAGYLDAGTAGTTLPRYIQEAVARQVQYEFEQRKSVGLTNVDYPDGSVSKETDGLLASVKVVMNHAIRKLKVG